MVTREQIISKLKLVYDPEISLNIWDLGLVYEIKIEKDTVDIYMTLTSPFCPAVDMIIDDVNSGVNSLGVETQTHIVFDPPWSMDKISEEGRLLLDL